MEKQNIDNLHTYQDVLEFGKSYLMEKQILNGSTDAWYLFEYIFDLNRMEYLLEPEKEAKPHQVEKYLKVLERRGTNYPVQYIIGNTEFMGYTFLVNENVLIPRQDTELLVETAADMLADNASVLDMCTGSGCIIISLAKMFSLGRAVGTDISGKAVETALRNCQLNEAENVEIIKGDLFENVTGRFDVIISNPPYIPTEEIQCLMTEVRGFEPAIALDGSGDGLEFYRRIVSQAKNYLTDDGMIFLEIGWNQGRDVKQILEAEGFTDVTVKRDLAGLDRVIYGNKG